MIKHYLVTTIRNLRKNLLFSSINIIGLTLALISILFVFAWIFDETGYDNFHPNVDQMYRVEALMDFEFPTLWTQTPAPLSESLKKDFNDVVYSTMIKRLYLPVIKLNNQPINESGFYFVTPDFFNIFGVHTFSANPDELISEPYTILISESAAHKYFGSDNPVGKTIEVNQKNIYTVKGIFSDYPHNSHLEINFIASFDNLNLSERQKVNWDTYNYTTYITVRKGTKIDLLKSKLKTYHSNFINNSKTQLQLQKVKDIHLYADSGEGNITYIYIFSVIGVLILAIAFINFINISTAKALERTREIAVRKTFGATRKLLKQQIYTELVFLVVISVILSFIISISLIPGVNIIANKEFTIGTLFNYKLTITLILLIVFAVIASGFYPAVYLSSFDPGVIISNKNNKKKGGLLRKVLVTLQLAISAALILGVVVIRNQMHYVRNKNLGFDKENLLFVNLNYKEEARFNTVGESIMKISGIDSIAFSHHLPVEMGRFRHINRWDSHLTGDNAIMVNELFIDHNFITVYGIKIKEGRNFRDDDNEFKIIINQKAANKMGLPDPVGKRIYMGDNDIYEIVGVAEDFHFKPLSSEITPLLMYYEPVNHFITVKLNAVDIPKTIKKIEKEVIKILPEYPFVYGFVDAEIDSLYRTEMRISKLVGIFTMIAIITSCLGIFGLSAFMAESRTKEIGIRKTLGASTRRIIYIMTKEILIITILADILGGTIGYLVLEKWLANFEYKITFSIYFFLLVLILSVFITLITNGFHAIRSSRLNPAKILKYE